MRRLAYSGLILLALAGAVPAAAQDSYAVQQRWDAAQARYRDETARYQHERDIYERARGYNGYGAGRGAPPPPPPGDDRDEGGYDPASHYRDDPRYGEHALGANDRVYRGSDDRYYCQRSDGTTGLIVGAAGGGILGNVIDGGHSRTAGTLIGGALGALAGRSIEQNSDQNIRCR